MTDTAPQVTMYTTDTCSWCGRAKDFLRRNNVPFVEKDVAKDYDAAMEMIRLSGQQGVPVTVAGSDVILGFDQQKFQKLAERFAGPKRPPLGILAADADEYLAKHPDKAESIPAGTKGVYVGKIRLEHRGRQSRSGARRHHYQFCRQARSQLGCIGSDG